MRFESPGWNEIPEKTPEELTPEETAYYRRMIGLLHTGLDHPVRLWGIVLKFINEMFMGEEGCRCEIDDVLDRLAYDLEMTCAKSYPSFNDAAARELILEALSEIEISEFSKIADERE